MNNIKISNKLSEKLKRKAKQIGVSEEILVKNAIELFISMDDIEQEELNKQKKKVNSNNKTNKYMSKSEAIKFLVSNGVDNCCIYHRSNSGGKWFIDGKLVSINSALKKYGIHLANDMEK